MSSPTSGPDAAAAWLAGLAERTPGFRRWLGLAVAAGLLGAALTIAQAWLLSGLLADLVLDSAADSPGRLASVASPVLARAAFWALAAVLSARGLLAWLRQRAGFEAGRLARATARRLALDGLAALPRAQRPDAGAASTRLIEQVEALDAYYGQYLPQRFLAVAAPLMIVTAALPFSWLVSLALLMTAPVIPLFMVLIGRAAEAASQKQFERLARMGGRFLDLLKGLPTLKLLGRGAEQADAVARAADEYRRGTLSVLRVAFLSSAMLELLASVAIALSAVYLGLGLLGRLDVGHWGGGIGLREALFMLMLAPEFYLPLRQLGAHYHARAQAIGAAPALMPLTDQPSPSASRIADSAGSPPGQPAWRAIVFEGVRLRHADGRRALDGVDLRIAAGERVAIVGESGAGKTSLLDVALGLAAPTSGRVVVELADGGRLDLAGLDLQAWRAGLAWLGQSPEWFSGSLGDNIRIGAPGADRAALELAAARAGVTGFSSALPAGLDTRLGEDGAGLSGGQLQRVALARALLREAPLWVLDEPTAHLDEQTEAGLLETLAELAAGRTVLMVTHRRPDPRLFDRVVRLADGRVVDAGEDCRAPKAVAASAPGGTDALTALRGSPGTPGHGSVATPSRSLQAHRPAPAARVPLLAMAWRRRGAFGLSLLLGLVTVLAGTGLLAMSGWFLSAAAVAGLSATSAAAFEIFRPGALIRLLAILRTGGRYGERLVSHDATLRLLADLRVWLFRRLEPLAPAGLSGLRSGDLLQRLVGDVDALDGLFLRTAAPAIQAWGLFGVVVVGVALAFGPWPALAVGVPLLLAVWLLPALLMRAGDRVGRRATAEQAALREASVETLRGLTTLQLYGAWPAARQAVLDRSRAWLASQARLADLEGGALAAIQVLGGAAALSLLAALAPQVAGGGTPGPWVVGAVLMALALSEVLAPLAPGFLHAGRQRAAAERLGEIAGSRPAVTFPEAAEDQAAEDGAAEDEAARGAQARRPNDITVRGLRFAHLPGRPVLDGVDLDIPAGRHLAVTGASGSGKTTLLALLARIVDPDEGSISLGGRALSSLPERELRERIAAVTQHPHVFDASLAENLRIAAPQASDEDLWRVLETVRLADWIRRLPAGMETRAGAFGTALSGGQARRLAMARALLRDAPVLMLDEPTEGLDSRTEAETIRQLREAMAGRTLIVVTHRPAVAAAMDRILRLDEAAPARRPAASGSPANVEIETANGDFQVTASGFYDSRTDFK